MMKKKRPIVTFQNMFIVYYFLKNCLYLNKLECLIGCGMFKITDEKGTGKGFFIFFPFLSSSSFRIPVIFHFFLFLK